MVLIRNGRPLHCSGVEDTEEEAVGGVACPPAVEENYFNFTHPRRWLCEIELTNNEYQCADRNNAGDGGGSGLVVYRKQGEGVFRRLLLVRVKASASQHFVTI